MSNGPFNPVISKPKAAAPNLSVELAPARKYPAIISPTLDLEALLEAVGEIKELVEILIRVRGNVEDSAFTVADANLIIGRIVNTLRTTYVTKDDLAAAKGDRILGLYDQATDVCSNTGLALLPADDPSYKDRDYYVLEANGAFISTHPDLAGETGGIGDNIILANGVWNHVPISNAYLSSVIDDTAEGHITLAKVPTAASHASRLEQVDAVQTNLDTHVGHTAETDDVHQTKTYTDAQDAAHAALNADPDDPHQTKTYTDQEIEALATAVLEHFVSASYGGLTLETPATGYALGVAWQTMPFTAGSTSDPVNVIQNPANDSIIISQEGTYYASVTTAFTQDDSNQGRITYLRFWNISQGQTDGQEFPIGIGRNSPAASGTWTFAFDIGASEINNEFRVEIGGGDTVLAVDFLINEFSVFNIAKFKGVLT